MAWSMGLIESMKNINLQMISTDKAVVIKDMYPKSKYHYLVLPWEDISNIYHVSIVPMFAYQLYVITRPILNYFKFFLFLHFCLYLKKNVISYVTL